MRIGCFAYVAATLFTALFSINAHGSVDWLIQQSQPDGSIATAGDIATPFQSTSEGIRALRQAGGSSGITAAEAFLATEQYHGTEYLARLIEASLQRGASVADLRGELLARQNPDGGYGELPGYQSTPLDTAFALSALAHAGDHTTTQSTTAVSYLLSTQGSAGGWSLAAGEPSVFVTAYATQALWQFRLRFPSVVTSLVRAKSFLLLQQQATSLWSSDFETALCLIALAPLQTTPGELNGSVAALTARRAANSSWSNDVYTTALVLQAIALAPALNANPDLASITAAVIDGDTLAPLSGVTVKLTGGVTVQRTTDTLGRVVISGLTAGQYTLEIQSPSYPLLSAPITLSIGQQLDLGTLRLLATNVPTVARIVGHITDAQGADLPGVTISVSGGSSVVTDSAGRYVIDNVPPGNTTLSAAKPGYFGAQGFTTLIAGSTVNFSVALNPVQTSGFNLIATFRDSSTLQPLSGVSVAISGSATAMETSDSAGRVSLTNLTAGSVQIVVTRSGYQTVSLIATVDGGSTVDISTDLKIVEAAGPPTFALRGTVKDNASGQAIVGANVVVSGSASASTTTDSQGNYQFAGLTPGAFSVVVSGDGYSSATGSTIAEPYQTIDFSPALSRADENPTGLHVLIVDDATSQPIEGALVTVSTGATNASAVTDPSGEALLRNLEAAATTVIATAPNYQKRQLTFTPTAGFINDLGTLRLLLENQSVPVQLTARIVDSITDQALSAVQVTAIGLSETRSTQTDANGRFTLSVMSGEVLDFEFTLENYASSQFTLFVTPESSDLGQIRLRPAGLDVLLPDLVVTTVDASNVSSTIDTYSAAGVVSAQVENRGSAAVSGAIRVVAFEDRNRNGTMDTGEAELGSTTISTGLDAGDGRTLALEIAGTTSFRDVPITVLVDASNSIIERLEDNNNATSIGSCVAIPPAASALEPVLKWHWNGSPQRPTDTQVFGPVMVGQMSDDNGDGEIDQADVPDLIFATRGQALTVVSGDDGRTLWQSGPNMVTGLGSVAVGDIDNDGLNEIVSSNGPRTQLVAFENNGTLKWSVPNGPTQSDTTRDGVTIADLNQDGVPEIISGQRVYSNTGALLWQQTRDHGGAITYGTLPLAADINGDGKKEVIAGRTAYTSTGAVLWHQASAVSDGFNAIGNFDADASPEIVLVATGRVYLLEHTGAIKWGPITLSGSGNLGGAPTVGDFDGDGQPEIGIAGATFYTVLETDGSVKWRKTINDTSSARTGSSLFDFDGDGRTELAYADETNLFIYDGATGSILKTIPNKSGTTLEYPVIADVDGDGRAELVLPANDVNQSANNGVRVFEGGQGEWMPTRAIWNQHTYHITNVNDDGSIPAVEEPSWLVYNSYRQNAAIPRAAEPVTDLTAGGLKLIDNGIGNPVVLSVRIGNAGAVLESGVASVAFYDGVPGNGGVLLGSIAIPALAPGAFVDLQSGGIASVSAGGTLFAVADSTKRVTECNELNNTATTPSRPALGTLVVATSAPTYAPGAAVRIHADVKNTGLFANSYRVELTIQDSDGDLVAMLPAQSVTALVSGATRGLDFAFDSTGILSGFYRVHAELLDSSNQRLATVEVPFEVRHDEAQGPAASLRVTTDRTVYNSSDLVLIDTLARNLTTTTLMQAVEVRLTIADAQGTSIYNRTLSVGDLTPSGLRQLQEAFALTAVSTGDYSLTGVLVGTSGQVLATMTTHFNVINDPAVAIRGSVSVSASQVYIGQTELCTRTVENRGPVAVAPLKVRHLVVNISTEAVLEQRELAINVPAASSDMRVSSVVTSSYTSGDYACVLQAQLNGEWRDLAYAAFSVTPPPIKIASNLALGTRGRLLVLVDPPASPTDATDPFGPADAPDLNVQREHIEAVLEDSGWSYTLVNNALDFEREFDTRGYEIYVVLSESEKLSVQLQRRVTEAVQAGSGLLVAGNHDRRNSQLETALGIKSTGKNLDVLGLNVANSAVMQAAQEVFVINARPQSIKPEGATVIATYQVAGQPATAAAATVYAYGEGKTIYMGYDLPLQGAAGGDDSLFAKFFLAALDHIHPEMIMPRTGHVLPFVLTLTNEGMPTNGRVIVTLPPGAQPIDVGDATVLPNGTVQWSFALTAGEEFKLPFWIRLPLTPGDFTVRALIQTGSAPQYVEQGEKIITVRILQSQ